MSPLRRVSGVLATIGGAVLLAKATALPVPWHRDSTATLRLSWTARPEWIEQCRAATDEELAKVEAHMRQRVVCEGAAATYDLRITVDDAPLAATVVRGGGLRHDRPMHVLMDQPVAPGERRVQVALVRREEHDSGGFSGIIAAEDTGLFAGRGARELEERARRAAAAVPPRLLLDTLLHLAPREVTLIRYDADRRRLEVRPRAPR